LRYESSGVLRFAGAHEYIVVWRAATRAVELVRTPGTWVGVLRDIARFTAESEIALAPGDLVLLYTDGVTEAMNADGEQFGLERLEVALSNVADAPVERVVGSLLESVNRFAVRQYDDITLLVMRQRDTRR
jgi:serine phosphatase RsbU (regulator of sigma subunit)